jgi:hypothetical protein
MHPMADVKGMRGVICRNKGCDDVKIEECIAESGVTKELFFCAIDGCYFVKINGRERIRSDLRSIVYDFFRSPLPE